MINRSVRDWIVRDGWKYTSPGGSYRFIKLLYDNRNRSFDDNTFSDWLYGDYDEEKLRKFRALYSVPGVRDYMDYLLDLRNDKQYLRRYGMDYSDIRDPRRLSSINSGSTVISRAYQMVSKNLDDLYPD